MIKNVPTLIYQDQDALNSVRVVLANAEKAALINMDHPHLKEERVEERKTAAVIAGIASGVATLAVLMAFGALSASASALSGPGISSALSHIGKMIGGVLINSMFSGIVLLILAPVLVGGGVYAIVYKKLAGKQMAAFLQEKAALYERARACRDELKKQMKKTDPKWQSQLQEQLTLVESVISNLTEDIEVKTRK